MFARVTTTEGPPERVDEFINRWKAQVSYLRREMRELQTAYLLVDRQSGRVQSVALWDSREAIEASEAAVVGLRQRLAHELGMPDPVEPTVEIYEVAAQV